jgi:hypothetical protein
MTGTNGDHQPEPGNRWRAHPVVAFALRLAIVAVPLAAGYGAAELGIHLLMAQLAQSRWWLVVPAAVSLAVCLLVERVTRRLLPLAALLKLSMLFPDRAPSRFKIARKAVSTKTLEKELEQPQAGTASSAAEAVLSLITALTSHDRRTRGHSERVRLFAELLGEQLRLPRDARDRLRWASLLHDIGKLQVAVDILNKPSKLSSTEFELIAQHPVTGEQLLGPLVEWLGEWGGAVRQHHEKYDGTGYPDGAAGAQISRAGRIVCIADSFEVMTAHRAYKKPMATSAARAELARCAGTQFDPAYVRAFLSISLPKLLWAMGPGSLLMNVSLLRTAADVANKGAIASAAQGSLAAASAAAVIGGSAAAVIPVGSGAVVVSQPIVAPPTPITSSARPTATPTTRPGSSPTPTPTQTPSVAPTPPTSTPAEPPTTTGPSSTTAGPAIAFTSVPAAEIAATTVTIGFAADATATAIWCRLDTGAATDCTGTSVSYVALADGAHTVTLWAEDGSGISGASISTTFAVDTQAPTVGWITVPATQIATNTASVAVDVDDPAATLWCALDGAAAAVCTNPSSFSGLSDGPHTIEVYGVDAVGNVGASISTSFTVDTTGPTLTITSAPPATITGHTATVAFTSDDPASTTWCSVDGATATTCVSPGVFGGLADGAHTIALHGVDGLGNTGPTVSTSFTVDTTAPVVTLTSVPSGVVPSKSVSIGFSVDDPTATTWCSIDGGSAAICYGPVSFNNLGDGAHTVDIYAVDPAGNTSITASHTFTVNSTAPTVTLGTVPAHETNSTTATVSFTVDDPSATAWCSLDGAAPTACTSPVSYSGLADGAHTISVFAQDGPLIGSTVTTGFTVDTVAPALTVTAAPSGSVRSANASVAFSVNDPTATAWCAVDSGPAATCTSPIDYGSLPPGAHTISLYAVDPAGNVGATSHVSFTIDNTAPVVTLSTTPPATSASATVSASFTVNDGTAQAWCSLDGGAAQTCNSTATYAGLANGSHTIRVYAVDSAGNVGATVATTFTVATAAPVFTSTPSGITLGVATYSWVAVPGLTYQYSYDGTTWTTTSSTSSNTSLNLIPGTYTFRLRGTDSRGNHTAVATAGSFSVL